MTDKSITISIDAMGGDNAPSEIVKGAVLAVNKNYFLNRNIIFKYTQKQITDYFNK